MDRNLMEQKQYSKNAAKSMYGQFKGAYGEYLELSVNYICMQHRHLIDLPLSIRTNDDTRKKLQRLISLMARDNKIKLYPSPKYLSWLKFDNLRILDLGTNKLSSKSIKIITKMYVPSLT